MTKNEQIEAIVSQPAIFNKLYKLVGGYWGNGADFYEAFLDQNWDKIGEICQSVWVALPDDPSIHNLDGFYDLCHVAEIWCFGGKDE